MRRIQLLGNPHLRERLRDLPTGYLLDLLADCGDADESDIRSVLQERGLNTPDVDGQLRRRAASRFPRGHALWRAARGFTLASAAMVAIFNTIAGFRLLHGEFPFKIPLLFLAAICIAFGFLLGFKLTTCVYQGDRHRLDCGFPLPVGFVELTNGEETVLPKFPLVLTMAVNAMVGVTLLLFPLMLIIWFLG